MTLALVSFALGILVLQMQPALPGAGWIALLPLFVSGLLWKKPLRIAFALGAGLCWALAMAHLRVADRLAPALEGRDLTVVGVVSSLPATSERGVRFELEPEQAEARLPQKILLSWYRSAPGEEDAALADPVHAGERWRLTVRLRRPHGSFNPHGFDYEAWLLERGIGATGYVRPGK